MKRCNAAMSVVLMAGLLAGGCAGTTPSKPDKAQIPPVAVQKPESVLQQPEKSQAPATTVQEPSSGGEQKQPAISITQMPPSGEGTVPKESYVPAAAAQEASSGGEQKQPAISITQMLPSGECTVPKESYVPVAAGQIISSASSPNDPFHREEPQAAPPPAYSLTPSQLHCNANVPWASLSAWTGEEGRCTAGTAYTVIGELPDIAEGYIITRMRLPGHGADEADATSSGRQPIVNHKFEAPLCIVRKDVDRHVVMQAYASNGSRYGGECGFMIIRLATQALSAASPAESGN